MFWIIVGASICLFCLVLGANFVIRVSIDKSKTEYTELNDAYRSFDEKNLEDAQAELENADNLQIAQRLKDRIEDAIP